MKEYTLLDTITINRPIVFLCGPLYDKNNQNNYIGGATFLEMYDAFCLGKQIYMLHDVPEGMLKDEIIGFNPTIIHEDLSLIK